MQRRMFLKLASAAAVSPALGVAQGDEVVDMRRCRVVLGAGAGDRGAKAAQVLVEEAEKRCGIRWSMGQGQGEALGGPAVVIYLATRAATGGLKQEILAAAPERSSLREEGFLIRTGGDASGRWIAVVGADDRGLLFGVGALLRRIEFDRQSAMAPADRLHLVSHPEYKLRGHQLGYRPKTNAYDGWSVAMWDQYIRELAIFGTNAIELVPPVSDDLADSAHFPLPPAQMMVEMSRIADSYGLEVWVWYPAMETTYATDAAIEKAIRDWGQVFAMLPRVDAILVPGGDPGDTPPAELLALVEKQSANLRHYHPKATVWISPQSFNAAGTEDFFRILEQEKTQQWLDGVVVGPQSRLPIEDVHRKLPAHYQIRCYPDITHSVECQYPVPDWDVAFAVTEGREVINPRPRGEANILRRILPNTVGFITYSEGCNDDVNKFVWSSLGWDSSRPVLEVLRDFAHFFIGSANAEGFAQGLLALEQNWQGPLASNHGVEVTLRQFQDMESAATPALLENWRFQQGLYRAYYDAFVRRRLLAGTAQVEQACEVLATMTDMGWGPVPTEYDDPTPVTPPNGLTPEPVLARAQTVLEAAIAQPVAAELRQRIRALGEALFQSIHMQLAVELYQGEAVERGTNLDTLDAPVSDTLWLHREIGAIRRMAKPMAQVAAVRALLFRTDPGPGGFYDHLGDVANRPHLITGAGGAADPEFRSSVLIGFDYPEPLHDTVPMAWKCWGEIIGDAPLTMHYAELDPAAEYRLRVVHSGDSPDQKLRLVANGSFEIHPYMLRTWPPAPQEFPIPPAATKGGQLTLSWTREPGQGGNGRGCQVCEVWLIRTPAGRGA